MNLSTLEKTVSNATRSRLAKLGAAHGFHFDGDTVRLNAMFTVINPAAHQRAWALQLWACPVTPASAAEITGQLVAEAALPPIGELADDTESFEVSSNACTPAGQSDHVMVLALVSGTAGRFEEVNDFAVYPRHERFLQPRLGAHVGFRIEGGRVAIEVERIENPRDLSNISGTLSLELWALDEVYRGGRFQGVPLAGVAFDPLSGQFEYHRRSFDLPFHPPSAGTWNLTLMLREWTAAGFVTRDFANFPVPLTVAAPVTRTPDQSPASVVVEQSGPKTKSPTRRSQSTVSVNTATKEQLATVKGLPKPVAAGIVSKRPFKSLDDLTKVKGMGAKLLARVRSKLRL